MILRATDVPVGDDQVKHIELTRQLAKSFNHKYGMVFPLPAAVTGQWHTHTYVHGDTEIHHGLSTGTKARLFKSY